MCFYCFRLLFSVVVFLERGRAWVGLMSQMSQIGLIGRMRLMGLIGLACLLIQKLLTPNSFIYVVAHGGGR